MMRNFLIAGALISLGFIGWWYLSPTESLMPPAVVNLDENLDSEKPDEKSNLEDVNSEGLDSEGMGPISELTEQEKQRIIEINEEVQALTHVTPIPTPTMPNIGQSLKLPDMKSLTVNDLDEPSLNLNRNRSADASGSAESVDANSTSNIITSTTTPVIKSVSSQTGIPEADIEAAFNKD